MMKMAKWGRFTFRKDVYHAVHFPQRVRYRIVWPPTGPKASPNTVVACRGGLGMGKTALTRGMARAGLRGPGHQPHLYHRQRVRGATPLFHFDMYRLEDSDELFDIGWEDYLERGGVCAVEWSENVATPAGGRRCGGHRPGRRRQRADHHRRRRRHYENTGFGDLGQDRVRGRGGKRRGAGQRLSELGLTHSVTLMPLLDSMLKNAGLTAKDMGLIAVAAGPGSFTGLRIGVSAAKGLAWALELPCCGVSTLEAMAENARAFEGTVICAMDARRQQIYNACSAAVTAYWSAGAPIAPWRWRYWRTS